MSKQEFVGNIRIVEELKLLIPPLSEDEKRLLEQSIIEEGRAYNALWLWGDALVDGHHRLEICQKHDLPYETVQVYECADTLEEVQYRMRRDAIGQRNLPPTVQSRFRAKMVAYQLSKGKKKSEAVQAVARDANVSQRQVHRDVKVAETVDSLDEEIKPVTDNMSAAAIGELAKLPKAEQKRIAIQSGGDGKKATSAVRASSTDREEDAKKIKSIAHQHRDKLVRAIDDYNAIKEDVLERERLVRLVQSVVLW